MRERSPRPRPAPMGRAAGPRPALVLLPCTRSRIRDLDGRRGRRRGAARIRQLVFPGDRAAWSWNLATQHFPTQIADLYHAREHRHDLARRSASCARPFPAGSPARAAWSIAADPPHSRPGNCVTRPATCWPPRQRRSGSSARTDTDTEPGNPIVADAG